MTENADVIFVGNKTSNELGSGNHNKPLSRQPKINYFESPRTSHTTAVGILWKCF